MICLIIRSNILRRLIKITKRNRMNVYGTKRNQETTSGEGVLFEIVNSVDTDSF